MFTCCKGTGDNQQIECGICFSYYTQVGLSNVPLLLPCGHTLCSDCVGQLFPRQCPFDRSSLPANSSKFPVNFDVLIQMKQKGKGIKKDDEASSHPGTSISERGVKNQEYKQDEELENGSLSTDLRSIKTINLEANENQEEDKEENGQEENEDETFIVIVKTLTGNKNIKIELKYIDTVETLKQKIEVEKGVPPSKQRLIFKGKYLDSIQVLRLEILENKTEKNNTVVVHMC